MPEAPMALDSTNHWLVPFASVAGDPSHPDLPNLDALATLLLPTLREDDAQLSLNPPHERALARLQGLQAEDGALPWAAIDSENPHLPQAWVYPVHLQVGMDRVTLLTGEQVGLDAADSRALFDAFAPLCAEDGVDLVFENPMRWRARGERLRHLACASLDRVAGQSLAPWMPRGAQARWLQRLQSEAQMLFYTLPVNDARQARNRLPINGVWFGAPGALPQGTTLSAAPHTVNCLREPALSGDTRAWQQAWIAMDQALIRELLNRARRGESLTITLCGVRSALTLQSHQPPLSQRLGRWIGLQRAPRAHDWLHNL